MPEFRLLAINFPCLVVNIAAILLAVLVLQGRSAKILLWVNATALGITILNIAFNFSLILGFLPR